MESELIFTSAIATYALDEEILPSPKKVFFQTEYSGTKYSLSIEQRIKRTITVSTKQSVNWFEFLGPLYCLERLLMVLDGTFIPLKDIEFSGPQGKDYGLTAKEQVITQRLS